LVGPGVDLERVLAALGDQAVALLGDDRSEQDRAGIAVHEASPPPPSKAASAVLETISERAHTRSATSTSPICTTCVRSRLRKARSSPSSSGVTTTTSGRSLRQPASSSA